MSSGEQRGLLYNKNILSLFCFYYFQLCSLEMIVQHTRKLAPEQKHNTRGHNRQTIIS